jgi:hypothetical protein
MSSDTLQGPLGSTTWSAVNHGESFRGSNRLRPEGALEWISFRSRLRDGTSVGEKYDRSERMSLRQLAKTGSSRRGEVGRVRGGFQRSIDRVAPNTDLSTKSSDPEFSRVGDRGQKRLFNAYRGGRQSREESERRVLVVSGRRSLRTPVSRLARAISEAILNATRFELISPRTQTTRPVLKLSQENRKSVTDRTSVRLDLFDSERG